MQGTEKHRQTNQPQTRETAPSPPIKPVSRLCIWARYSVLCTVRNKASLIILPLCCTVYSDGADQLTGCNILSDLAENGSKRVYIRWLCKHNAVMLTNTVPHKDKEQAFKDKSLRQLLGV